MSFTKVAPAGIGTEPGVGYRIGNSFLHAGGVQMGFGSTVGAINGITTYYGEWITTHRCGCIRYSSWK